MHDLAPLVYDLALMLGLAGLVVLLFQRIKQPVVLGYLIAGIIVGPYTPPYTLVKDIPNIQLLSQLGVIFLMFALGLEFSFQKLMRVGFSASLTGIFEVAMMTAIGYGIGHLLGWSQYDNLFLGAALAISSTTIIIKAIDELGLKSKRFAELIFGVLIVEDLLAILLLVALSTLVMNDHVFSYDMLKAVIQLILVVGGWILAGYFIVPPLFKKIAFILTPETLTIISVALCLILVCGVAYYHYSPALGAFIMGSILAETVLVHKIEKLIYPIRDIFAAVFFISVGMLINPVMIIANWPIVLLLSLVTVFGKVLTTGFASLLTGQSLNTSVRVGFGMAQVGEFSFIIAALGASLNVTSEKLYPLIVAVSGITTFTTPYLIRLSGHISEELEKRLSPRTKYFLESYSAWIYRSLISSKSQSASKVLFIRLLINAIIVAIIFTGVDQLPIKLDLITNETQLTETLSLLTALTLTSPFIWGMLFSYRSSKVSPAKTQFNPTIFMIWLATLAEISILGLTYFHTWVAVVLYALVAIGFFLFAYRHLESSYQWFEERLMSNLKLSHAHPHARYEELAPWDTHLVEIIVGEKSPLVGKTLSEEQVLQKYGVNVVAIRHGDQMVVAPRGEERIIGSDQLIVLGNDKQIDRLRKRAETRSNKVTFDEQNILGRFALKALLIDEHHRLIGKSIRNSNIRETVRGLVVGLERNNVRILNPEPDTVFKADDLLLLVGEADKLAKFV